MWSNERKSHTWKYEPPGPSFASQQNPCVSQWVEQAKLSSVCGVPKGSGTGVSGCGDGRDSDGDGNPDDENGNGNGTRPCHCILYLVLAIALFFVPWGNILKSLCSKCVEPIPSSTPPPSYAGPGSEASPLHCELIDQDKTGMPDIALESLGGLIVGTRETQVAESRVRLSFFGIPIIADESIPPETIIRHKLQLTPGYCWAFKGSTGNVIVQLIKPAVVTGAHLEHIHKNLDPYGSLRSAPREFSIWGLKSYKCLKTAPRILLGNFTFQPLETPLQYFEIKSNQDELFGQIELEVLSNYGDEKTCIYRFRVHGIIEPIYASEINQEPH